MRSSRPHFWLMCALLLVWLMPGAAQQDAIRASRLGITFISGADIANSDTRYRNALALGAGWNRWPLYWQMVETSPGGFDWSRYDGLVNKDLDYGLNINAVLLGIPGFRQAGAVPANLDAPVFTDGSDAPGPGKAINPDNYWARFVYEAVQRYQPGGALGRAEGIRVWEMWNEPDFAQFWQGTPQQYARLLQAGYLAAHHADPNAQVMFGGLLYTGGGNWLAETLKVLRQQPGAASQGYFFDLVGVHSYHYPWRTGWLTRYTRQTLGSFGLDKPIWINESGIAVWDDYPGPVWASGDPGQRSRRATADQQAWYIVQSSAYGFSEGAQVIFFHQLYDDCGDQGAGTNFPPHNGELCSGGATCYGDGFGIYRNESGSVCYSQHPAPGTPRPAARAYRMMAEAFGRVAFSGGAVARTQGATVISFNRPTTGGVVRVAWNRLFSANTIRLPARTSSARVLTMDGEFRLDAAGGSYNVPLGAAVRDDYPDLRSGDRSAIGGPPIIIIEDGVAPPQPQLSAPTDVPVQPELETPTLTTVPGQPTPTPQPTLRPTLAPPTRTPVPLADIPPLPTFPPPVDAPEARPTAVIVDTRPPQASVEQLPELSPATFTVRWRGDDDGEIVRYLLWVRVDFGEWRPWLETSRTAADYTGLPGTTVEFAAWALDSAGNWSSNTELTPQAITRIG